MRMETYIRKSLGMKAHWVTEVVETEEGWVARVDRLGNRRLRCGKCRGEVNWAKRWERVTHALVQAMALLAKKLFFKEVAEYFELDWKGVVAFVKRVVEEGLKLRKVKTLHLLGIDEVSRKKGHRYLTLVYDLERGRLL